MLFASSGRILFGVILLGFFISGESVLSHGRCAVSFYTNVASATSCQVIIALASVDSSLSQDHPSQ